MAKKKPDFDLPEPEIIAGGVPPDAAIEFWKWRAKLTDEEAKALGEEAKHRAFYVTGLARHDLVQLVSDGIEEALRNGETLPRFKERIMAAIQTQGWHDYRIENIFRTNLQTAYAAGRYKKMRAVKASRPYWQYMAVMDRRVRPSHAMLHGKVYPADHEFWASNYPPNGFRCRCCVRTLSEHQVKKMHRPVETEMPRAGVWTDPKTGMEYFVHFPGADKGFKNNPGKDWVESGLDLKKYPDVNRKSYEEQRGPASKRPAPVKTYAELGEAIKARLSQFATNNGITSVVITRESYFMATYCDGRFMLSEKDFSLGNGKSFNPAKNLKSAWNKLSAGKPLTWNEEYACESLWHEITHNRQKRSRLPGKSTKLNIMEIVTQWTARRTYNTMLEELGGSASHQKDIIRNGLGYGTSIKRFDRLLSALFVNDEELLPILQNIIREKTMSEYVVEVCSTLSQLSGAKRRDIQSALSAIKNFDEDFDEVLKRFA
ncbi:phage minor head protein [uncultured Desulfovibrio sp.]|uniref:phage head morphogenesis protein n=1 Tax=uncultured Desulfovibrio sp. TaxID=167968 RepID=UPI002617555A|nr:phage minor head protein [uncultured Desulfovibrio sp.]